MSKTENHPKSESYYGTFASFHKPRNNPDSKAVIMVFDIPRLHKPISVITAFPSILEEVPSIEVGSPYSLTVLKNIGKSDTTATEPFTGYINPTTGKWEDHDKSGYSLDKIEPSSHKAVSNDVATFTLEDASNDVSAVSDDTVRARKESFYKMMMGY